MERFNLTARQRISRRVRKARSLSKKRENHVGAIWLFAHHYTASLCVMLRSHLAIFARRS